jgi:hypothetical protein
MARARFRNLIPASVFVNIYIIISMSIDRSLMQAAVPDQSASPMHGGNQCYKSAPPAPTHHVPDDIG